MKRHSPHKAFWRNTGGAVAATYALALIPLIGIAGLGFDYARLGGMDTELQNAADQAALAGATQLDRTDGSMQRAIFAIQGGLVVNDTLFSNDGEGQAVGIDTADGAVITFYATRADAEAGTNGFTDTTRFAEAGYVGVTVETRASNYTLTPIVGAVAGQLNASAIAGLGSALCRIPPLMICNPDEGPVANPSATFGFGSRAGTGMKVVAGPSGGSSFWEPGNYGFLDLGNGASGVAEVLGWLGPGGGCTSLTAAETIEPDTEPGLKVGAIDAINTRFDVYQNSNTCKNGGTCPAAFNSRKDLVRLANVPPASNNSCSATKNTSGWHETGGQRYLPGTASPLDPTVTPSSMGHPRDMCHAVSVNGTCSGGRFGDGNWDRDAYFRSHYVRTQTGNGGQPAGSRWAALDWPLNLTQGPGALPTTSSFTRYEVYLWELARAGDVVDGVRILDPEPLSAMGSTEVRHSKPICSQQYGYSSNLTKPDRRVMTVAVVNCKAEEVKGKTTDVAIANWMDVFLVQPSVDRDRTIKSDIYFEVIRETDLSVTGQNNAALIRRDVPYLLK